MVVLPLVFLLSNILLIRLKQYKRDLSRYLQTSYIINWKNPSVLNELTKIIKDIPENDDVQKAIKLFYYVRDNIKYRVTTDVSTPNFLKASTTLARRDGHCVCKAILLTAFARSAGIPTKLHFVDLKNHQLTREWIDKFGEEILWHGYVEFFLDGKWVKANPAYDKELCIKHNYQITEFNGKDDALFAQQDLLGNKFIEYVKDHGTYARVPYIPMFSTWFSYYAFHILKYRRKEQKLMQKNINKSKIS